MLTPSQMPDSRPTGPGLVCIAGTVNLSPSQLLGATNGTLTPLFSSPIPIRQVVGPAGGPTSLTSLDGSFANLCGRFVPSRGGFVFDVQVAVPVSAPACSGVSPQHRPSRAVLSALL